MNKPVSLNEEFHLESLSEIEFIGIKHNEYLGDALANLEFDKSHKTKQDVYTTVYDCLAAKEARQAKGLEEEIEVFTEENRELDFLVNQEIAKEKANAVITNDELNILLANGILEQKEYAEIKEIFEYMMTNPSPAEMLSYGLQKQDKWNELRQDEQFNGLILGATVTICVYSAEFWADHLDSNLNESQAKILPWLAADVVCGALGVAASVAWNGAVSGQSALGSFLGGALIGSIGIGGAVAKAVKAVL